MSDIDDLREQMIQDRNTVEYWRERASIERGEVEVLQAQLAEANKRVEELEAGIKQQDEERRKVFLWLFGREGNSVP